MHQATAVYTTIKVKIIDKSIEIYLKTCVSLTFNGLVTKTKYNNIADQIYLEQLNVILPLIRFFSFFCASIRKQFFSTRNCLLLDNYKKLFSFGKLVFSGKLGVFLSLGSAKCTNKYNKLLFGKNQGKHFISHLGLERLLGRLNQQSFQVMRNFYILCLISSYPNYKILKNFMLNQQSSQGMKSYAWVWKVHHVAEKFK